MTDSNVRLERRYRRMLRFYPRSYREQHGEDMLGVLMTGADDGKKHSRLSAALDLLRGAVLVHTRYWWEMRTATDRRTPGRAPSALRDPRAARGRAMAVRRYRRAVQPAATGGGWHCSSSSPSTCCSRVASRSRYRER